MHIDEVTLIKAVKERAHNPKRFVDLPDIGNKRHELPPPVSPAELSQAKQRLGFQLTGLLRSLYLQVGNGGFGLGYGLLAVNRNGARNAALNLVDWYLEEVNFVHPDYPPWPRFYITLCDWGDSIRSMMNAVDSAGAISRYRGNAYKEGPWENVMRREAASLHDWLENWLNDLPLFEQGQFLQRELPNAGPQETGFSSCQHCAVILIQFFDRVCDADLS
jgi:hypothetical protein